MFFALIQDFYNHLDLWEKILGALAGIGVSLFAILKGFKIFWKAIMDANSFAREIGDLIPEIKKMTKEFKPNGGKSLMDVLNRLENHLCHTDQKIRVMASCIGIAAFETDKLGLYTFVSKQWCDTTNLSIDQALGNGWVNILLEDDRDEVFKEWHSCITQNREFHFSTKLSSNNKDVSIVAWPIRNLDHSVEKFFGILI